jgi:hypothetical protein
MTRGTGGKWAWRCSAAAVMAMAAVATRSPVAAQVAATFTPPQSAMILSRTQVRALPDGKTITTRRIYEVRITRAADGFQVDGHLVNVEVDAPPSLQSLVELERRRPDNGLFPMRLDARGMIVSVMQPGVNPSLDKAVALVSERIGGSGLAALDMLQAQAFVRQLREGGGRSVWPSDVFRPAPGKRSEERRLALPGGREGQVVIEIAGEGSGPAGQVAALSRIVTTDLGGDRRTTQERWQITRIAADFER